MHCLYQGGGVQGCGHFGVDLLHGAQAGHNGIGVPQGVGDLDGVGDNVFFGFHIRGDVHGRVCHIEQAVIARNLEEGHMGQHRRIPQADVPIQYGLQNDGGIYNALHTASACPSRTSLTAVRHADFIGLRRIR